jgi:uncharacterized damage-inducible protein DinB
MEPSVQPFYELLRLNTKLFANCLDGLDEETARTRVNGRTNNVAFITCHLVDARYFLASYLGAPASNPLKEVLEGLRSIEDFTEFPLVREVLAAWEEVSERLAERFGSLRQAELEAPSSQKFPLVDGTVLGGIAFLIQHESYHLGQLGLLRRAFDLEPMSYD